MLLIGERFNNARRPRWEALGPGNWYMLALRLGAFPDHGRYDTVRLESVLGRPMRSWLGSSLNLTPPGPQDHPFDRGFAARVAVVTRAVNPGRTLVLVGRRVATAFGVKRAMPPGSHADLAGNRLVFLPHPSGLSRFWNDADEVKALRDLLKEALCQT